MCVRCTSTIVPNKNQTKYYLSLVPVVLLVLVVVVVVVAGGEIRQKETRHKITKFKEILTRTTNNIEYERHTKRSF